MTFLVEMDHVTDTRAENVFMILLRAPDCPPNCAQHPHVLKYIPVFPRCLTATEGRSLQIINTFWERVHGLDAFSFCGGWACHCCHGHR
jgi:hypothetical protein